MMDDANTTIALLRRHSSSPKYGINNEDIYSERRIPSLWGVPYVAFCALSAASIMVIGGVGLGFTSPTLTELGASDNPNQYVEDKSVESSLFAAFGVAGAPVGAILAWPVCDFLGRKPTLMIGGLPFLVGWLILAYAHLIENNREYFFGVLYLGRILGSFSTGWSIFCVSVYISEVSSAKWKGRFGNCNQLFFAIGAMLVFFLGIRWNNGFQISYSTISLVAIGIILVFETLMCFTVESPRWLYKKKRGVTDVLRKLRGNVDTSEELEELSIAASQQHTIWEQMLEFKKCSVFTPFLYGIILMLFQQYGGIAAVIAYSTPIFRQAGFNDFQASLSTAVATGTIQIFVTLLSACVIDHFGRKVLLVMSSIGLLISTTMLGAYFFIFDHKCSGYLGLLDHVNVTTFCVTNHTDVHCHFPCNTEHFGFIAIVSIVIYMSSFAIGWGPIVWTLMSELLPDQVRTLGGSMITVVNWSSATVVTLCFQFYVNAVTIQGAWWTFSFILILSIIFVIVFLPETKGHSLKAIQDHFKKGHILAVSCCKQ